MELYREIEKKLVAWKDNPMSLPLVLEGARQIGKTWLMLDFGKRYYRRTAYFNFESSPELAKEFELSKSPERLISILSLYCGFDIDASDTLIVFDEIQECNTALNSLKYFSEYPTRYHIIAAGSLLGVTMSRGGTFPVGRVEFLKMYPLTFREFLYSADRRTYDYMDSLQSPERLPEIIYNRLHAEYRRYLICGGMPKAVLAMLERGDIAEVDRVLQDLLHSYTLDFSKHAPNSDIPRIGEIWASLPSQLAKENRKFIYKLVRPGARAREYEDALLWLSQAGLVYRVNCCSNPLMPLSAYDDVSAFKVYVFDVGVLRALSKLPAGVFIDDTPLFREFKGAFIENAVLEGLVPQFSVMPRYWVSSGRAEVDFLVQGRHSIMPVEVKAENNRSGRSLSVYINRYKPEYALIISTSNISVSAPVIHLPQSCTDWISSLIQF